jgi:hypothetical protein
MPLLRRRVVIGMAAAAADPVWWRRPQRGNDSRGNDAAGRGRAGHLRTAVRAFPECRPRRLVQKINSGAATAAALAGGGLDVGILNSVTVIEANAHGVGLSILFPNRMHVPGKPFDAAMVTAAASSIRSGRDLNGRTIGCTAIKDASWLLCRAWMDANGGDSTTAKFVEVPFSAIPVALESGRIDAV